MRRNNYSWKLFSLYFDPYKKKKKRKCFPIYSVYLSVEKETSLENIASLCSQENSKIIIKDCNRSLGDLFTDIVQRNRYQQSLSLLLRMYFALKPDEEYYQGFHDVASVVLLSFDSISERVRCLTQLSVSHFSLYLSPNHFSQTLGVHLSTIEKAVSENSKCKELDNLSAFCLCWLIS